MKLNASYELIPVNFLKLFKLKKLFKDKLAKFAHIHTFVPTEQAKGYSKVICN